MPTTTFNYTGAQQAYVVPAGVTSVKVKCWGAQGGGPYGGGYGGYAEGDLAVTPGETLYVFVGGAGSTGAPGSNFGYNGGGQGSSYNNASGGGGGGASDVRRGGNTYTFRKIVGAGGGGSGGGSGYGLAGGAGGHGGGASGNDGAYGPGGGNQYLPSQLNGKGATQSGPGAGGAPNAGPGGYDGIGGNGTQGGGGGGGGYYGGGGAGGEAAYANTQGQYGAGGGCSYVTGLTNTVMTTGQRAGNGLVTITTPNNPPGAPGVPGVAPSPVNTNGTITYTAAVDPDGDAVTYDVELSTNNGGSWAVIVAGTASLAPVYNFAGQPATTTAKLRVRAKDSLGAYGAYATMAGTFSIVHNVAPTAATGLSPDGGTIVDRGVVQRLAWTFNDPDPGDTQSKFDLRWRIGVGAWTTITQTTTNRYYDAPAATFPAGNVEWQVMPYDAQGLAATAWSASAFFTAGNAPAAPAITSPANNAAQGAPTGVLTWSTPTQDAYQVRKVADNAGVPNTSTVYYDTGTVVSSTARDAALDFPVNMRTEHLQVRERVAGLWSTWSSVKVNVAWSPPAVPTIVATARADLAAIDVVVTSPAPVAPQPVVASTELWRRRVGGAEAIRLTAAVVGGVYRDVTPASGVAYEYQALAIGVTGTRQASAWTP